MMYGIERENFICHSNEQEYHTIVTIQQNISTRVAGCQKGHNTHRAGHPYIQPDRNLFMNTTFNKR